MSQEEEEEEGTNKSSQGNKNTQASCQMFKFKIPRPNNLNDSTSKGGKRIHIPMHELIRHMNLPPSIAAYKLKVSVSTLKRRFWEVHEGKQWPISENDPRFRQHDEIHKQTRKGSLLSLLNSVNIEEKYIDEATECILDFAFRATSRI
ncbi:hypothetical protein AKO1_003437 [Acrasis kona]|uniref:RWP-RK domain-containing protein n=1 Tax=Acrasis kona TaxID=1008807 RepID=A0AAW2Z482_9EUKA